MVNLRYFLLQMFRYDHDRVINDIRKAMNIRSAILQARDMANATTTKNYWWCSYVMEYKILGALLDRVIMNAPIPFPRAATRAMVETGDVRRIEKAWRKIHSKLKLRANLSRSEEARQEALKQMERFSRDTARNIQAAKEHLIPNKVEGARTTATKHTGNEHIHCWITRVRI